jgi:transcriptional regulator with XRE-family HTH domain
MGFGKTLQALREEAGITQSELAQRADVSIDSLRNWEQDRALPKIDVVTRMARAMGFSLDRLAYTKEEDKAPADKPKGKPPQTRKGK